MTPQLPGEDATPLDAVEQARWDAAKAQAAALSQAVQDGSLDDETLAGGVAALTQVSIDRSRLLNAVHLPEDAGDHAAGLERMLRRIPDGWGRWVRCDAGWYALLVELDTAIAALLPEYEILQMKEKYGTLRFYWGLPELTPACCAERAHTDPRPLPEPVPPHLAPGDRTPEMQAVMESWLERELAHLDSDAHRAGVAALQSSPEAVRRRAAIPQVRALVEDAEQRSWTMCERCGGEGVRHAKGFWVKTLCAPCAEQLEYSIPDEE